MGFGSITQLILVLSTKGKSVVSFMPHYLPSAERAPGTHQTGGWVQPRAGLDAVWKKNIVCRCQEPNHNSSGFQPVALSLY